MMSRFKIVASVFLAIGFAVPGMIYGLGYHGPRQFKELGPKPPVAEVILHAQSLKGVPYDPLMGEHDDLGGRLGFMVCSDVPNIAYGLAGYSLAALLAQDFKRQPWAYDSRHGNKPGNPYFHRRARNLFAYFKANQLMPQEPKAGDLAFYSKTPNGMIAHVALITKVTDQGYQLMESAPKTLVAQEVTDQSPLNRGWIFRGFGRLPS